MAYEIISVCCGGTVVIKAATAPNNAYDVGMPYYECCNCGQVCTVKQQEELNK